MPEWSPFDFVPGGSHSAALTDVHHVVHVGDAWHTIESGVVPWQIIYDASRLNKTRTHVTWLSANTWAHGSIYGTVQFSMPWSRLVAGRKLYWVEAITAYNPSAFRFLLTDQTPPTGVTPYDPAVDEGPIKILNGEWRWNSRLTAEFMVESPLPLADFSKVEFIQHNGGACRRYRSSCPERNVTWTKTAARVVGYLVGTQTAVLNEALLPQVGLPNGQPSTTYVDAAYSGLYFALGAKSAQFKGPVASRAKSRSLVRAALLQYALGDADGAKATVSILKTQAVFDLALRWILTDHFSIPDAYLTS